MKENKVVTKFVAMFIIVAFIVSAIGIIPAIEDTNEEVEFSLNDNVDVNTQIPLKRGTRGSSPRTVLTELFTNWGCPNCPKAGVALDELMDVYDSSQLVVIAYHCDYPSGTDPFYIYNSDDQDTRIDYYGVISGIPRIYVDGPPKIWNGPGEGGTYTKFKNAIDTELAELSNMTINLEGYIDHELSNGIINATIEITDPLPSGSLKVRFGVVEDNQYEDSPNGDVRHRNVLRDLLDDEPLPPLSVGQTFNVSRTFTMDPNLNWGSISVVVFVQNDSGKDVLQAGLYDYIPQDILVVDDDESENPVGYEDDYLELLTQMEYSFDGWTLNDRGSPTSNDLANYKAVIWITADTSNSTLTTADQTEISDYLDNGRGSVFITGENVGADIGSTSFYQDYLHSNFITNDTSDSQISGISNDPISDPFYGTTIPITSSSPSEISPISPATSVFHFSPSAVTGGIKAIHDYNSKVVYFAFMYFEGSDSDSNKMVLMERILNWMMNFSFYIPLSEGWNLISIPYIQSDTSIGAVLEYNLGEYDSLQCYDSPSSIDSWKHYHNSKPSEWNDLSDITHEIGFWMHIIKPGGTVLICNGIEPAINQSIDLHIGWNLVGYPSHINREIDAALNNIDFGSEIDSVWTYDVATQNWDKLGPTDTFELGKGYWIHSTVETTWDVPL